MATWRDSYLIDFLKSPDNSRARIHVDNDKWLYWQTTNSLTNEGEWVVQYRPFGARRNRCLYSGNNLGKALEALVPKAPRHKGYTEEELNAQ